MKAYRFRDGHGFRADPNKVGDELDRLIKAGDGKVTPAEVVEFAADESTETHKCFTWDDADAATRYRTWEARRLLRSVEVVIENRPVEPLVVNVRMAEGDETSQHYSSPTRIRREVAEQIAARGSALARLESARAGVEELERILGEGPAAKRAARGRKLVERAVAQVGGIKPAEARA